MGSLKAFQNKPFGPGQHGRGRKRKQSEYAVQLGEKQKVKYMYGVLEKQFRNLFDKAARKGGVTGYNLLRLLEARLDNVAYRMGIAPTRRTVNGHVVNIPSYQVLPGDIVAVREQSKSLQTITDSLARNSSTRFSWVLWDNGKLEGTFVSYPERDAIPENIKEQLIVELYSK
jgi:small subunit ribosomal protein S4